MKDYSNSAKRVLNLVLAVQTKPDKSSAAEVWAGAFGLDEAKAKTDPHEVIQMLSVLRHELDLFEEKMVESGFSDQLFKPYIKKVRSTVSPHNIGATWNNYKSNYSADTILSLRFCSEILEAEPSVDFSELEKLLSELEKFKDSLDSSTINGITYQFIISQIRIIENAIRSYPIVGGASIKKAFSEGFADLNDKAEDLVKEEETEVTRGVGKFWKDLKSAGNEFVEADRITNAFIGIINKGQSMAESVITYLPGAGS